MPNRQEQEYQHAEESKTMYIIPLHVIVGYAFRKAGRQSLCMYIESCISSQEVETLHFVTSDAFYVGRFQMLPCLEGILLKF